MIGLDERLVRASITAWLLEDAGRGDITTSCVVPSGTLGAARIEGRESLVVAGLQVAAAVFHHTGQGACKWVAEVADGATVGEGEVLARIEGPMAALLTGERTALNILQRMSGVATATQRFVKAIEGTRARIVDTRKTVPGLRIFEKYAVRVGGGRNHRFGLDDGILVKDNHVMVAGSVAEATRRAVAGAPHGLKVEVEIDDLDDLEHAISNGADAVLLDNMTPAEVARAVDVAQGRVLLEASGGVSLDNVRAYAETGVDLISVGAITHSAPAVDIALEVTI